MSGVWPDMNKNRFKAMKEFGNALRDAREARELRLCDVAEHLGISIPFLSDVENGRRPMSDERIEILAKFLRVDSLALIVLASKYRGKVTLDVEGCTLEQIQQALTLARSWSAIQGTVGE